MPLRGTRVALACAATSGALASACSILTSFDGLANGAAATNQVDGAEPGDARDESAASGDSGGGDRLPNDATAVVDGKTCTLKSTNTTYPGTGTGVATGGPGWADAGSVTASDDVTASVNVGSNPSSYLVGTSFGLSIPPSSAILGVEVAVERRGETANSIGDSRIILVLPGGGVSSAYRTRPGFWATNREIVSYGGATDTWGEPLTPAIVNDPAFGAGVSAVEPGGLVDNAYVDSITVVVHYCE